MVNHQQTILWWGRFDANYSRNRILRQLLGNLGYRLVDFRPKVSFLGGVEAFFTSFPKIDAIWVPAFRQNDFHAAHRCAQRLGVPLIFDPLISAWDKAVFERRKFLPTSTAAQRLQRWEKEMFSSADLVLADTSAHAQFYVEELGAREDRVQVVQVGAEEALFRPQEQLSEKTIPEVLFYGSFINLQGPEVIVEAALTVPEVRWTLLGDGPLREKCLDLSGGMEHICFEDWLPYEQLPERIGRASILLGIFGSSPKAGRVIANKVYQALACSRPLVTRESAAFPSALRMNPQCGISFVPAADSGALAATIRQLVARPDLLAERGQQARDSYELWFSEAGIRTALVVGLERVGLSQGRA